MPGLLLAILMLAGCASVERLAATMNARNVQSCLRYTLAVGMGIGTSGSVTGVTATGGVPIDACLQTTHGP